MTQTLPCLATLRAKLSPAMPLPMTRKSNFFLSEVSFVRMVVPMIYHHKGTFFLRFFLFFCAGLMRVVFPFLFD
jgi:hypothetical protein